MNIERTIRGILEENLDIDELYAAITQEVEDRIDYSALAEQLIDSVDLQELSLEVVSDLLGE